MQAQSGPQPWPSTTPAPWHMHKSPCWSQWCPSEPSPAPPHNTLFGLMDEVSKRQLLYEKPSTNLRKIHRRREKAEHPAHLNPTTTGYSFYLPWFSNVFKIYSLGFHGILWKHFYVAPKIIWKPLGPGRPVHCYSDFVAFFGSPSSFWRIFEYLLGDESPYSPKFSIYLQEKNLTTKKKHLTSSCVILHINWRAASQRAKRSQALTWEAEGALRNHCHPSKDV